MEPRLSRAVFALIALMAGACAAPDAPSPPGIVTAPTPTPAWMSTDKIADAIRFRSGVGFRADEAYVRELAADPSASIGVSLYGVPLTAGEIAELDKRARNSDLVGQTLEAYGQDHSDEWAGTFVDQAGGGLVVIQFTGHLGEHQAALSKLVNPEAFWEVRAANWSLADLNSKRDVIDANRDWFESIDASYIRSSGLPVDNVVEVRISSANPAASTLVVEHFNGAGWLRVISDGIGRWKGPTGGLHVQVTDDAGRPLRGADLMCLPIPDDAAAYRSGPVGVSFEGVCRASSLGATGYNVQILGRSGDGWVVVTQARTTIVAGREVEVAIAISRP